MNYNKCITISCKSCFYYLICNKLSCFDPGNQLLIITNTMNIFRNLQPANLNVFLHGYFLLCSYMEIKEIVQFLPENPLSIQLNNSYKNKIILSLIHYQNMYNVYNIQKRKKQFYFSLHYQGTILTLTLSNDFISFYIFLIITFEQCISISIEIYI